MQLRPLFLLLLALTPAVLPAGGSAQAVDDPLDPTKPLAELTVDLWTEDDGLPQNMASAIAQTTDGFLWLGMEEGLTRFDGVGFRVYRPENTPAFTTSWVTSLHADPDGTLWIGTAGGGLVRHRGGEFTAIRAEHGLPDDRVRALARDHSGALWIGTEGGGVGVMTDDGTIRVVTAADGLASDVVLSLAPATDGSLWVGTTAGVTRLYDDGARTFTRADGLPGNVVSAVLGSRDGSVWLATPDAGLARYADGTFTVYSTADGLTSNSVTALHEDAAGAVWVGTNGGGLNRLYDGVVTSLTSARSLPGNLILSLGGDREGGLWLGMTGAGLVRLREGMFRMLGRPEGLQADIALALHETEAGDLWIGTAGGGAHRIRNGATTAFSMEEGLPHSIVLSIASGGPEGDVWVGTPAGLSRIRDGSVTTFALEDGLLSPQVTSLAVEPDGALWIGTPGQGVQRWNGAARAHLTTADGLPSDVVTTLLRTASGALWVGTRDGLARIDEGQVTTYDVGRAGAPSNIVNEVLEGPSGTIWIATNDGLARLRPDGELRRYDSDTGPFDGQLHAAVEDSLGYLWVSSNRGIHRVAVADLDAIDSGDMERVRSRRFSRADGLRSDEANGGVSPAGLRRRDGSIWIPTMRGAARIEPLETVPERPVPTPVLETVVVNEVPHPPHLITTLGPHARSLEFRFTAPTFVAPQELGFRYRLEGFDEGWIESGARREAFYTALPAGEYTFRVSIRRGNGPWSTVEAAQSFQLQPYLHETWWFRALALAALMALAWLGYSLRVRRLERRQKELLALTAEQRRAERALRESRERLQLALDAGRMGTWEWDLATGRLTLDEATEQLMGSTFTSVDEALEELGGRLSPEDHNNLADVLRQVAEGARTLHADFSLPTDAGDARHLELRGETFLDDTGRPHHVVGVVADVSELMHTQGVLRLREEELRHAQKMEAVGRLAGGVAHDFNNLLTTILGRTQFLKDGVHDDEAREDIEEIQKSAERAANLTQQLLMFSRKQVVQPRVIDLNELIDDLKRMLRRLLREDVILETSLAAFLPGIHADPGSMEQVLVNLVVNAQDAMPQGGRLSIETTLGTEETAPTPTLAAGPFVVLTVSDTGEGMTEHTLQHAFDPFFTTKPVGKGTGLGLATVYGIVQQCGGDIRVDTELGLGTTFRIYLPASREALSMEAPRDGGGGQAAAVPETPSSPPDGSAATSPLHILLVEDDDSVRPVMEKVLSRQGYHVVSTASGAEALDICRSDSPIDLLLSDVVMPGMSGRELVEAARELRPEIAFLLVSGHHDDEVLLRGIDENDAAFLRKPFDVSKLLAVVDALLEERQAG